MAFNVDSLDEKNTPWRWRVVGDRLVKKGPESMDHLHPFYKDVLTKAAEIHGSEPVNQDELDVAAAINDLEIGLGSNPDLDNVTTDLTFPTTGLHGTTASWDANGHSAVSNAGVVTRPAFADTNVTANIVATVSKGTESDTKTFSVTVLKSPE